MIGIDVGGANLKVAGDDGVYIHYCPLWEKAPITELLYQYVMSPYDPAAVVMSGELADCFTSKTEGISRIVNAVKNAFPAACFYGTDARFHKNAVPQLAAANWLASADYLREDFPGMILVDIGSTTTDIIPLAHFSDLKGLTDLQRLQKGYLLYTGMLRTTVPALLKTVEVDGIVTPVSSEFFACSADVHLVLGHIGTDSYTCDTPDRKEKTKIASLRRLARVVCADLDEIGERNAVGIAQQFWDTQRELIMNQVAKIVKKTAASGTVIAGIGAPLFARESGGIDLSLKLGRCAYVLPACAVRELALRDHVFSDRLSPGIR